MHSPQFLYQFSYWQTSRSPCLAIVNSAAMHTEAHVAQYCNAHGSPRGSAPYRHSPVENWLTSVKPAALPLWGRIKQSFLLSECQMKRGRRQKPDTLLLHGMCPWPHPALPTFSLNERKLTSFRKGSIDGFKPFKKTSHYVLITELLFLWRHRRVSRGNEEMW